MFQLLNVEDTVILEPAELDDIQVSVEMRLDVRYKNKIIQNEGPCLLIKHVCILDKIVIQSEGSLQVTCSFDCLVMKPTVGSLLTGTVMKQSEQTGLTVMIGDQFVNVPRESLLEPCVWQHDEWYWQGPTGAMPYKNGGQVKLRIQAVERDPKDDRISASCGEEGLGMMEWGWHLN